MSELKEDIRKSISTIGKQWKKEKLRRERVSREGRSRLRYTPSRVTIKDAAWAIMAEAFRKASGNVGIAVARQIYYAARKYILERTGEESLSSSYFTQTLLKDYIKRFEPSWADQVVWDARGHLREPHTKELVGLGGLEVRGYMGDWTAAEIDKTAWEPERLVPTIGPQHRFGAVLFIEKEGFDVILRQAKIGEQHDLAIMSSKGVPVGAACEVANRLHREGIKVLVLRDFDKAGFTIVKTLRRGTRLKPGTPVTDLGLRLEDIEELDLEGNSEPVTYRSDPSRYLVRCGATQAEIDLLVRERGRWRGARGRRVELNAMTSDQLIEWLERKLESVGVAKVLPGEDTLADAYRRAAFLLKLVKESERIAPTVDDVDIPSGLRERVAAELAERPQDAWDQAIWRIAGENGDI